MKIEEKVAQIMAQEKVSVAVAESCTGGLTAKRLTDIPGSSAYFTGSVTAYTYDAKKKVLGIPMEILKAKGAVCEDVALLMAKNVRRSFKAHYGIGITGIAGPTGGSKTKPVGLVYISVATNNEALCIKCQFEGSRAQVRQKASTQALKLLLEFIA